MPSYQKIKNWPRYKRHTLEIIDEFLEKHRKDKYTHSEVIKLAEDEKFNNFWLSKFKDIFEHTKAIHDEKQKEYHKEMIE